MAEVKMLDRNMLWRVSLLDYPDDGDVSIQVCDHCYKKYNEYLKDYETQSTYFTKSKEEYEETLESCGREFMQCDMRGCDDLASRFVDLINVCVHHDQILTEYLEKVKIIIPKLLDKNGKVKRINIYKVKYKNKILGKFETIAEALKFRLNFVNTLMHG
jgi:hypothetical protein